MTLEHLQVVVSWQRGGPEANPLQTLRGDCLEASLGLWNIHVEEGIGRSQPQKKEQPLQMLGGSDWSGKGEPGLKSALKCRGGAVSKYFSF